MILSVLIEYKSEPYNEMVALRDKVLRKPLGLSFTEHDLAKDANDILLGLSIPRPRRIGACCILTRIDKDVVKLRQMAVDDSLRGTGIGAFMLSFAESVAIKEGFGKITLHARKIAAGFYLKYNYNIVGEEFIEVGIPHLRMEKNLTPANL
ncbi:GNAT family N-acetyltransferase [Dysgonomonas sp. 521]|uniref:GNAT family N-acetyltransferase n=1 Tax=Dysgonomonas sp. 521 TaxID=2302932 RepID=UPI0013D2D114|nr:GNAT family N-acetyltransferase [Dysgonomonas sp. 521]NDV94185.1 GNAT family N-acetyltransferase [Dysgonomonas sp. 521]